MTNSRLMKQCFVAEVASDERGEERREENPDRMIGNVVLSHQGHNNCG